MTPRHRVTTVVVSRDRKAELLRTLAYHDDPVILVDNGSDDGTTEAVSANHPQVRVIRLTPNRGAPARNLGVRLAATPYVAFADDDSWWAPGALSEAAELFDQNPRLGLAAARILLGDDNVEDPLCRIMADSPLSGSSPGKPILGFAACAAVVRRDAFLAVGGFDPVVFFGGEETRVAWDLAAAGWELRYFPELVVHHHPSSTRQPAVTHQARIARNTFLTAVMRRSWPVVAHGLRDAARSAPGRRGLTSAGRALPRALLRRRRLPAGLEADLRLLEEWESDLPSRASTFSD